MTALEEIDAFLFDLGQVVIRIDFGRAIERWADYAGCDSSSIRPRFSPDIHYERHETGEIDAAEYFDSLRHSLGIDLTDAQFLDGWNRIFAGAMPGIADMLKQVSAKKPVYAFSNTNRSHERHWSMEYHSLVSHFDTIFVSSTMGLRKPDPAAYAHVVSEIGASAEKIHFFDDHPENVRSAEDFGMRVTHVTTDTSVRKALQQYGFNSPSS